MVACTGTQCRSVNPCFCHLGAVQYRLPSSAWAIQRDSRLSSLLGGTCLRAAQPGQRPGQLSTPQDAQPHMQQLVRHNEGCCGIHDVQLMLQALRKL
jgi:hypothetical protein